MGTTIYRIPRKRETLETMFVAGSDLLKSHRRALKAAELAAAREVIRYRDLKAQERFILTGLAIIKENLEAESAN